LATQSSTTGDRRHAYVTTIDAGVDLRDTQIAARHADARATMRYDRARALDLHPNYIFATYVSSATRRRRPDDAIGLYTRRRARPGTGRHFAKYSAIATADAITPCDHAAPNGAALIRRRARSQVGASW
jgi:hypothetical protein